VWRLRCTIYDIEQRTLAYQMPNISHATDACASLVPG
jgi:hypothetical protein